MIFFLAKNKDAKLLTFDYKVSTRISYIMYIIVHS